MTLSNKILVWVYYYFFIRSMKLSQLEWSNTKVIPKSIWNTLSKEKQMHFRLCELKWLPLTTTEKTLNIILQPRKNESLQAAHEAKKS